MKAKKDLEAQAREEGEVCQSPALSLTIKGKPPHSDNQQNGHPEDQPHHWVVKLAEPDKKWSPGVCLLCGCAALFAAHSPAPRHYACEDAGQLVDGLGGTRADGTWRYVCHRCPKKGMNVESGRKKKGSGSRNGSSGRRR